MRPNAERDPHQSGQSNMDSDCTADTIAEDLLHLTGAALLSRDFEAFRTHFKLPLRLETVDGHRFVETEAEFFEVFEAVQRHLDSTEVIDFVRTVIHADFEGPDTIRSVHLCSEIHAGGELRRSSYPVHSTLVHEGGRWKIAACLYVILDNPDHNKALVNVPQLRVAEA